VTTKIRLTVAQALIKFLDNQYLEIDGQEHKFVEGIFTIFGHGNVVGLGQALEEDCGDLIVRQGRNEQGMAHAATAFAKQNLRQKIYACTSSIGPGAANMVTAAGTATANRIPLLLLPGDTFACRQPDPVLQQVEHSYNLNLTTNDAFKAVSKYWDRVSRPEQLMTAAINAMRVLTNPAKTGAVTIALPQDVQGEAYDYPAEFLAKRVHHFRRTPLSEDSLSRVVKLITQKKKPLLICGGGSKYSGAGTELKNFAETFNIPFAETQAGKSTVVFDHPLNLGGIGVTGNSAANKIASQADLIIGIGTRFMDFTTASKRLFQNPDVDFVALNICDFDAYKLDAVPLVADAKLGLISLLNALKSVNYKSTYTDEIEKVKAEWKQEVERLFKLEPATANFEPEIAGQLDKQLAEYSSKMDSNLTQTAVLGKLAEILADDAIVVGSSGSLPGDLQRLWRPKLENTYHMEYGYSCMGYEISGALGVKLAAPDQEVYALVGDGSYLMLHSELITSLQERAKINIILFDNIGFGCINNLQISNGMGSFGTEFRYRNSRTGKLDGELLKIDFAASAAAYGAKTFKVHTLTDLESALAAAKQSSISTLIDIKVLPKTMTHGYQSWWRVGLAEVATKADIKTASTKLKAELERARQY
jgi:3D-(3,5/4)-trihydroxycyclohexane-1,2-dione acylhydrolase (decyclizing)